MLVPGLIALDRLGIVHRNISYSNLMLPVIDQGSGPLERSSKVAKIIDLGLAHWKDPSSSLLASSTLPPPDGPKSLRKDSPTGDGRAPRPHHHITVSSSFITTLALPHHFPSRRERSPLLPLNSYSNTLTLRTLPSSSMPFIMTSSRSFGC